MTRIVQKGGSAMLTINLEWDPNALAAPQSFRNGVQAAANVLEAAIDDPITVNVEVGYGEFDLGGTQYEPLTTVSLGGIAPLGPIPVSYSLLRAALANDETSPADAEAVNSLPDTVSLNGQTDFYISGAQAKVLGVISPTDPALDGSVGFPTTFAGNGLIDAAIVELSHALGLLADGNGTLSLFEYTSPGSHLLIPGFTSSVPSYFSTDGGDTDLANYDVSFDDTLFSNLNGDPLSSPNSSSTVLTPLDLTEIGAIGFDVTSTPSLPTPSITPTPTPSGVPAAVNVQNVTVAENTAIPVLSFITSVSAPGGDIIPYYEFWDQGTGTGHFTIGGVIEPDGQWIHVLDTQLSSFQYVGGPSPGSETIFVGAYDDTTETWSPVSQLIVATVAATPNAGLLGGLDVAQQLEMIYIGYFNRAADGPGFSFWEGQNTQAQANGESASTALTNIANAFTPQAESIALHPFLASAGGNLTTPTAQAGLTTFIAAAYENLFDHAADPAGAAYWLGQITGGAVGLGAAILAIANGATGTDATELQNKITVASDFTTRTSAAGLNGTGSTSASFLAAARSVLSGVDGASLNDPSVTAGENATTAYIAGTATGASSELAGSADTRSLAIPIVVSASNISIDPGPGNHTIQFLAGATGDSLVPHFNGVDQISGFDPDTDVLDLRSLLSEANVNLNGGMAALSRYLTVTDQGSDALISFDPAGHGGGTTIADLQGLGGIVTGSGQLFAQGAIRIA